MSTDDEKLLKPWPKKGKSTNLTTYAKREYILIQNLVMIP